MYGKKSWGGDINPFILLRMEAVKDKKDPIMSLAIFEWKDEDLIGRDLTAKDGSVFILSSRNPLRNALFYFIPCH